MTTRFLVIARHYPDLEPDYDGPELSLDEQVDGVIHEFPVLYGTRGEAQACLDRLARSPDPSFCSATDALEIREIAV